MYTEEGIGLAATQVDIHKRIIVIDVSENRDGRLVLINPELLEKSGETGIEEGCLSIPEQRALVPRAEKIKIRALDRDGNPFELEADDLLAICIQHAGCSNQFGRNQYGRVPGGLFTVQHAEQDCSYSLPGLCPGRRKTV